MISLRPYQQKGVDDILQAFASGSKAVLFVLPTGGGKTVLFTHIANQSSKKNKRAWALTHRVELLRQTSEALNKFDVVHGLINPLYTPNFRHNVQVASVQTLVKRLSYMASIGSEPDLIIIDEAHHATAGSWRKIIEQYPNARILGVTATPIRGDGQGLGVSCNGIFDTLIEGPTVSELINQGYLVKPRVFGPPEKIDLSDASSSDISMGDYKKDYLNEKVNKPQITGDAVQHYKEICEGVPTVVFCVNINHAENVAKAFRDAGYNFLSVDGTMDDDERKRILGGLADGSVDGVCSCDLISEGTDIPAIGCAILLRPTKSKSLYLQQVGRALRTYEGKEYAIVLDHVGNTEEHGLPWQEQEWTLEGDKKRKKRANQEAPIRVVMCESCFAQQEPAFACVSCGHIMKPPRDTTLKQVDGKLREITEADIRAKKAKKKEEHSARTLSELVAIETERGYKPGWANAKYMARLKKMEKLQPLMQIQPTETEVPIQSEWNQQMNW